jgi:hypothetical protein
MGRNGQEWTWCGLLDTRFLQGNEVVKKEIDKKELGEKERGMEMSDKDRLEKVVEFGLEKNDAYETVKSQEYEMEKNDSLGSNDLASPLT